MKHRLSIAFSVFFLLCSSVFSQTKSQSPNASDSLSAKLPDEPVLLLGLSPAQTISRFGPPLKVYSVRGAEAWQDDVVFEYAEGFSFFLFMEHVWQIRITDKYKYPVFGFLPGSAAERITSMLGTSPRDFGDYYEWVLPSDAWPVRMRAIKDSKGIITDLYVYRADF